MKKRLGDILLDMGFIGQDQLEMALSESKKTNSMIGDVLLRLDWLTEDQLQLAIAVQSGAKLLDSTTVKVDQQLLSEIPQKFVLKHGIFPFSREGNVINVATNNPFDVVAKDELARLTGQQVTTYIAPKDWISKSIELYYQTAKAIDKDIENATRTIGVQEAEFEDTQIVTLADRLIDMGAMDIIENLKADLHQTNEK